VSEGGFQTPGGSGNGAPPSLNNVARPSDFWRECRAQVEQDYPWLVGERVFDGIEAAMIVYDVEEAARHIGGNTWFMDTPEDYFPILTIYFTYVAGQSDARGTVTLQAVHAAEL